MYYFPLYLEFIKIQLKTMVEYRNETIWVALAEAAGYSAQFALIWVMT